MIQRIQTIYLLISIACLSILAFGKTTIIIFFGTTMERFQLTAYGIANQEQTPSSSVFNLPLYIFFFVLITLLVFGLFSFKNLKRQSLLIKISIALYLLLIAIVTTIYFFNDLKIDNIQLNSQFTTGFFILCIGLPALILANNGIKRDKKLIDSLNRLR